MPAKIKYCNTCGKPKDSLLDFYSQRCVCKECYKIKMKKWRAINREKTQAYRTAVANPKKREIIHAKKELAPRTGRITQTVVGREVERIAREALKQWGGESYWKSGEVEEGVKK